MRKRREHRPKRIQAEIRAVPESPGEEPGEVVRLSTETEVPEVEHPAVLKVERVRLKRSAQSAEDLEIEARPEMVDRNGDEEPEQDLEEVWEVERKKIMQVPIGWVVVLIAFAVGVLVVALWKIPKGDDDLERRAAQVAEKLDVERQEQLEAERLAAQLEEVATGYLAAETVEEKLKYVRMPERVAPLMESYYKLEPLVPMRSEGFYVFEPFALSNYPFLLMKMTLVDGGNVVLLMEEGRDGQVKVDWESHVAYQEMSLEEFVLKRPAEAMDFRVIAEYDEYYAYEFSDSDRYVSLALTERDNPGLLFGYVERNSEVHERIIEIMGRESGVKKPMILRVRFLPGSEGLRSVLVEKVVAPAWAMVSGGEGEE